MQTCSGKISQRAGARSEGAERRTAGGVRDEGGTQVSELGTALGLSHWQTGSLGSDLKRGFGSCSSGHGEIAADILGTQRRRDGEQPGEDGKQRHPGLAKVLCTVRAPRRRSASLLVGR